MESPLEVVVVHFDRILLGIKRDIRRLAIVCRLRFKDGVEAVVEALIDEIRVLGGEEIEVKREALRIRWRLEFQDNLMAVIDRGEVHVVPGVSHVVHDRVLELLI